MHLSVPFFGNGVPSTPEAREEGVQFGLDADAFHFAKSSRWNRKLRRVRGRLSLLLLIGAALLSVFSLPLFAERSNLDIAADVLAWVMFVAGIALRLWSTLHIGMRKSATLVCDGPYSLCRNPLYTGTFLIWIALALFLKSWVLLLAALLAVAYHVFVVIRLEERRLGEAFGEEYAQYKSRVPRIWPRFTDLAVPASLTVHADALAKECRNMLLWIWLPCCAELLTHLRGLPWWPHLNVWL